MSNKTNLDLPWPARLLYGSTNAALFLAGLANLVVGTWAAFNESAAVAATSLTAGLVLLFASTIDRFESLKGLGIEAKTRQLDLKIELAEDALKRIRELTELSGTALIELRSQMGRWGSTPGVQEAQEFVDRVKRIMASAGSDEKTIAAALEPWGRMLCLDVAHAMIGPLRESIMARVPIEQLKLSNIQPSGEGNPDWVRCNEAMAHINDFLNRRLRDVHTLKLDDYPEKFIALFDEAPLLDTATRQPLRDNAARFMPGMRSLRDSRTLVDVDLWTATIEVARR